MDVVDKATRSRMMGGIGGKNTIPELLVRSALHRAGLRFRIHGRGLPGRPDIVLRKHQTVIFVHGCFWHRHAGCRYATTPATNKPFWSRKFSDNVGRDARNRSALRKAGWRVLTVWECETRKPGALGRLISRVLRRSV
jgi:DNA mismatch endonuclease, patch repair protein